MPRLRVFAAALVIFALVVLVICQDIEDSRLEEKNELLTWAFAHAREHSFLEKDWDHPESSPQVQHLHVALEAETAHFHRETVNMWDYTMYGWKYWRSYQNSELQEQALARIQKARWLSEHTVSGGKAEASSLIQMDFRDVQPDTP